MTRGRGHGKGRSLSRKRPTCKLCENYVHVVIKCWHRFDDTFTPTQAQSNLA